ncbi:MAG: hypothetical protein OQK04_14150 [Kangiellaceae bacterium]|nr:hypothetical protein [Kangiellaceae bacterium]MCW8999846.1 hypothetical protein [Kangiellaceae bacterium]
MSNSSEDESYKSEAESSEFQVSKLDKLSDDEVIEAFISVDDIKFPQKALALYNRLSDVLGIKPKDIGVEHLVFNPYRELGANIFAIPLDERYTPEALILKEKLARLKDKVL